MNGENNHKTNLSCLDAKFGIFLLRAKHYLFDRITHYAAKHSVTNLESMKATSELINLIVLHVPYIEDGFFAQAVSASYASQLTQIYMCPRIYELINMFEQHTKHPKDTQKIHQCVIKAKGILVLLQAFDGNGGDVLVWKVNALENWYTALGELARHNIRSFNSSDEVYVLLEQIQQRACSISKAIEDTNKTTSTSPTAGQQRDGHSGGMVAVARPSQHISGVPFVQGNVMHF